MCKYMKSNSLDNILESLRNPEKADNVILDPSTSEKARECIENMFAATEK